MTKRKRTETPVNPVETPEEEMGLTPKTTETSVDPIEKPEEEVEKTQEEREREIQRVLAQNAMEMAANAYMSLLMRPLFPLVLKAFANDPPSIDAVLNTMAATSVGQHSLLRQITLLMPAYRDDKPLPLLAEDTLIPTP